MTFNRGSLIKIKDTRKRDLYLPVLETVVKTNACLNRTFSSGLPKPLLKPKALLKKIKRNLENKTFTGWLPKAFNRKTGGKWDL